MIRTALTLAAALAAPALHAAPARDWSRTVAATPSGSYVLGNPAARVKLVEYLSMTCPHCADFTVQAMPILRRDYIARGTVSLEVRHAVRDGFDMGASLLARCGGAQRYFPLLERLMAAQPTWLQAGIDWGQKRSAEPPRGADAIPLLASAAGIDAVAVKAGLPAPRVKACLVARPEIDRLTAMAQEAWGGRISGTPAFFINGALVPDAHSWALLKPQLDAALR